MVQLGSGRKTSMWASKKVGAFSTPNLVCDVWTYETFNIGVSQVKDGWDRITWAGKRSTLTGGQGVLVKSLIGAGSDDVSIDQMVPDIGFTTGIRHNLDGLRVCIIRANHVVC